MKKLLLLQLLICSGIISSAFEKRDVHRIILREEVRKRKPQRSPSHHRLHKHHKNHGHDYTSEEYNSYESLESSEESNYNYKDFPLSKPIKSQSYSGQKYRNKRQKKHRAPDQFASSSTSFSVHHRYPGRNHHKKTRDFFDNSYFPPTGHSDEFSGFTSNQKMGTSNESAFVPSTSFGFGKSFVDKNATYQVYEDFPSFTEKSVTLSPIISFRTHGKEEFDEMSIVHEDFSGLKGNKQYKKNAAIRQRRKKTRRQ